MLLGRVPALRLDRAPEISVQGRGVGGSLFWLVSRRVCSEQLLGCEALCSCAESVGTRAEHFFTRAGR